MLGRKQRGLVVVGVCCAGGSWTEKSVRSALKPCEERLTEHLTWRLFSIWTVTHSYDTARGGNAMGVRQHRKQIDSATHLRARHISSTENLLNYFTKTKNKKSWMFVTWTPAPPPTLFHKTTSYTLLLSTCCGHFRHHNFSASSMWYIFIWY